MFAFMIDFTNTMLAALVVGALFGAWLFLNPKGLSASAYVTLQQQAIRTMNKVMPILGAATIFLTITAAVIGRNDGTRFWLLVGVALCFASIGLVTRFLNQPINAIVMAWGDVPPASWMGVRDTWWRWHSIRVVIGLAGLSLLILSMTQHRAVVAIKP
jgi:uncharacterized membrane protein